MVDGGTLVTGFKTALTRVMNQYARELGILKDKDENFDGKDIRNGLVAIISIKHPDPQFEGQTKTKLGNTDAKGAVDEVFSAEVQRYFDGGVLTIYDHPWPGFTPDLLSIVLVTAIQAKGSVLIHQKMFESRLFFVDKLIDMGARIVLCDPHRAVVIGLEREQSLRGITMSSPDIRAGVSLLIAALSAEGKSVIQNIEQIDRGYQNIDTRLKNLGAEIKRI